MVVVPRISTPLPHVAREVEDTEWIGCKARDWCRRRKRIAIAAQELDPRKGVALRTGLNRLEFLSSIVSGTRRRRPGRAPREKPGDFAVLLVWLPGCVLAIP